MKRKMFFKSLCTAMVLCMIFSLLPFESECQSISKDVFRLHILANSDNEEDQSLKIKVRNAVLLYGEKLYRNAQSKEEVMKITEDNLDSIIKVAQNTVRHSGYSYPVSAKIKNLYFNTRRYEDISMPSGMYDALQIKIGSGQGKNWWCVMYPSMCLFEECDDKELKESLTDEQYDIVSGEEKYVFKFKAVEYFEKIVSFFS